MERCEALERKVKHAPFPHIFVTGDAADAFGVISVGHNTIYFPRLQELSLRIQC